MFRMKGLTAGLLVVSVIAVVAQKPRAQSPRANLPSDLKRMEAVLQKDPAITGKLKEIETLKKQVEQLRQNALPKTFERLSKSHKQKIEALQKDIDAYVRGVYEASRQSGKVDSAPLLTPEQFVKLGKLIRPSPGESRWEEIPWLLSVYDARKKAAEEGKPIFLWSAGGAPPLGGC